MKLSWQITLRKASKPLLFGLCGASGCLIAAILGELFLKFALPPAIAPLAEEYPVVDIMFVLDVTGSMQEEINGVKTGIQQFAQELSKRKLDAEVGLIAFGDRLNGEEPQTLRFGGSTFTTDLNTFGQKVGEITQVHGGDDPESSLDALTLAAKQPFRSQSTKVILLITDAPPKIPDLETKSIDQVDQSFQNNHINQLHLVIQPDSSYIFSQLQKNAPGEVFLLSETAAGRQGFEKILPVLGETIAQTTLKSLQTNQEYASDNQERLIIVTSFWTGILATGIGLSLIIGQNIYLRRRLLSISEAFSGTSGSLIAGIIAGAAGQILFIPFSGIPLLVGLGRVAGWTLLGGLLGGGISFFVPNLKTLRGVQGGGIGGAIGGAGFLVISLLIGDIGGRLLGGVILGFFIGLMVALLEQLTCKSSLIIHWNQNETTTMSLGKTPIILGSGNQAHIYLSQQQGYYPETAKIFQQGEQIIMEYNSDYGHAKNMKNLTHYLNNGTTRKFGEIRIEVQTEKALSESQIV